MYPSHLTTSWQWMGRVAGRLRRQSSPLYPPRASLPVVEVPAASSCPLRRPSLDELAQWPKEQLPPPVRESAVAGKYLDLLGPLEWSRFPERPANRPYPGPRPGPRAPFVAAYLVKLVEGKRYMSDLWQYLVEEPALVWLLGFPLVPAPAFSWGFNCPASLPTARHFSRVLRTLPNAALQFLLDGTVRLLGEALPPEVAFGAALSADTKHILAWVKANNPKAYMKGKRFDEARQPRGDPDCRVGYKAHTNQSGGKAAAPPAATPTKEGQPASQAVGQGDFFWGYASGVAATKVPDWGEFVLAELTQTADHADVTYFFPLMVQVQRRLGRRPCYGAFDAAFDATYVYDYFASPDHAGFAAIPLAHKGLDFDPSGLPCCAAGLAMPLKRTFIKRSRQHAGQQEYGRYACPLLFPQPTGEVCPVEHKNWPKGGCLSTTPTSPGARLRVQLDRHSDAYRLVYNQRTAVERINSQALELGIERPKLRNRLSITNFNTLIYVLINLRALQRVKARQEKLECQAQRPAQEAALALS